MKRLREFYLKIMKILQKVNKKILKSEGEEDVEEFSKFQSASNEEEEGIDEEDSITIPEWKPVVLDEIKTFISICIVMGLVKMPNIRDYWKLESSNFGIYGNSFISSRMSRNRFLEIRRFFGFDLDYIRSETITNFQKYYLPFPQLAVDETLLLFKGRFKHKQHIKGKPNSTGIKIYALNDKTGFFFDYWVLYW
jgi:hypothetical protein